MLENSSGSANFREFALFSPSGKLALTANGSENQLQLWRLPTATSPSLKKNSLWAFAGSFAAASRSSLIFC